MGQIDCAVIGAGWWGTTAHVPALLRHPKARLLAVQHHDPAQAERTARDFGVPHGFSSVRQVLDLPGLEAVVVSSTPNLHFCQAKAALDRGLHVLVEKPMCISATHGRELVELAAKKRVQLALSAPWHFNPHVLEARRLVRRGDLGQLKIISILQSNFSGGLYQGQTWKQMARRVRNANEMPPPYAVPGRTSYSDPRIAGGGQIYCQVSHAAMMLSFITARRPAEVFARFDNGQTAVDVFDSLSLKLDDGTLVSVASHGEPMPSQRQFEVRIFGTRGMLLMEIYQGTMEFHNQRGRIKQYPALPAEQTYPIFAPTDNLIDTIAGKAENGSPGIHGAVAMQIIDAACRSARSGRNIKISTAERLAKS